MCKPLIFPRKVDSKKVFLRCTQYLVIEIKEEGESTHPNYPVSQAAPGGQSEKNTKINNYIKTSLKILSFCSNIDSKSLNYYFIKHPRNIQINK